MSKIYEALLRAEQDRARKTGSSGTAVQTAEEVALANTMEPYVAPAEPSFGDRTNGSGEAHAVSPAVPSHDPVFDPYAYPSPTQNGSAPGATPAPAPAPAPIMAAALAAAPTPAPISVPAPSSVSAPISVPAPSSVPRPIDVAPAHRESAPAPVVSAPEPGPATQDIGGVRTLVWHPVLERLPSLAERGQSVEQFRSLRSRLAEFRDSSVPLKSLLITSGLPQEGKSFIAANLALSLSRHRANRVLLIDGDIRRSSLHAMLGTSAEPGLTEYLSGRVELSGVLQRCQGADPEPAFHNGLSSLTFIAGGSEPDKAADLSGSPRFAELLETLGPQFDWIIIDSSPVNLVSDGVNFARVCDGVLLVAREGVTKFETAQNAQQQLKSARLLGFVLNAVHTASAKTDDYNYGPYGTYGSYGGYGYSTTKR